MAAVQRYALASRSMMGCQLVRSKVRPCPNTSGGPEPPEVVGQMDGARLSGLLRCPAGEILAAHRGHLR